jgi:hypothetical protein
MVTVSGAVVQQVILNTGLVYASVDPLKVNVDPFKYDVGGKRGTYPGVFGQSLTDNVTSYTYLDRDGALVVNLTGFPTADFYAPLARVVTANGEVVAIHDERILIGTSPTAVGTCRITYPVDGDVKGGDVSTSSNNDVPSLLYAGSGTDTEGRNRLVRRPPQNYASGDVAMRIYISHGVAPGNGKASCWYLKYAFRSVGEDLGAYDGTAALTVDHSTDLGDRIYSIDLTIPAAAFNVGKDLMVLWLAREHSHAGDTLTNGIHVHQQELRYTGYMLSGQPGQ